MLSVLFTVGSLAQLVEQRTFNPLVAGSNPARPTTLYASSPAQKVGLFAFWRLIE